MVISAFGIDHGPIEKAVGRKDKIHISQVGDHVPPVAGQPDSWSHTHPKEAQSVSNEMGRRSISRSARYLGSYKTVEHYMRPAGPSPSDRPVGHRISTYRPIHTRGRMQVAAGAVAGVAAGAGTLVATRKKRG
jgi:hypothetical protein